MRHRRMTAMVAALAAVLPMTIGAPGASAAARAATPHVRIQPLGAALHATVGRSARLDGSGTRPGRRGDRLTFRWRVAAEPRGARARLVQPLRRVAGLVAERAGRYTVRLAVTEHRNGSRVGASSARKAVVVTAPTGVGAPAPRQPACAIDVAPMGCPIQTITTSGGIQLDDQNYPRQGNWVQLLVLDPTTLVPVDGGDQAFNADQGDALVSAITAANKDDLVILSGQGISYNPAWPDYVGHRFTAAQTEALERAFAKLGGTLDTNGATQAGAASLDVGAWSLIGHVVADPGPDGPTGVAHQNYENLEDGVSGFLAGSTGGRGSLNGYLQTVVNPNAYEYISSGFVPIDTSAQGSDATHNIITVGDRTYSSLPITQGQQAFQLLSLPGDPGAYSSKGFAGGVTNSTYITRNADGSVNPNGIHQLAASINLLRHVSLAGNNLTLVLQSFGRTDNTGLRQQISDNADWIADQLPEAGLSRPEYNDGEYDYYRWCGLGENGGGPGDRPGYMSGYPCELFPNTPTSFGTTTLPTITQDIGEMAGMPARNEVANLGFHGQPEALSFIGSTHPYSTNDASLHVGADAQRAVAVLRRTRQSQWAAAGASPGLTDSARTTLYDPSAMWQVIFGTPHQAWPLSGPPGSSLANASKYIAGQLFPTRHYTDIRQAYATASSWIDGEDGILRGVTYPTGQRPHFSRADFVHLKNELLSVEFPALLHVDTMINDYQAVFGDEKVNGQFDFQKIKTELIAKALDDNETYTNETVTVDEGPTLGSSLYFASEVIGALGLLGPETEALSGVLGLFAGTYDFFSELSSSTPSEGSADKRFDEPEKITDTADNVALDMAKRYQVLSDTFGHFEVLFDTDWGRLSQAADYASSSGQWSLPKGSTQLAILQQSLATAMEAGLYQAVVPLAYDQWVTSPWWTDAGGDNNNEHGQDVDNTPGPNKYYCDGPTDGPFDGYPDSSLAWVRFEAYSTGGQKDHFTGRALVSKAAPLVLRDDFESAGSGQANYPGVYHNGAAPDEALTNKLFQPPSKSTDPSFPDGLGLNEVGFLGLPGWNMPRLQCGMPLAFGV